MQYSQNFSTSANKWCETWSVHVAMCSFDSVFSFGYYAAAKYTEGSYSSELMKPHRLDYTCELF